MRLTIIPIDKAVYVDGDCLMPLDWQGTPDNVHALQWNNDSGWVEYRDDIPNETISVLPDWANNAYAAWVAANTPPVPTPPTAEQNKQQAESLLFETDWSALPSVSDPTKSNPYLANADEFVAYRSAIRQYVVTPVAGDINWPTKPKAIWQSTNNTGG